MWVGASRHLIDSFTVSLHSTDGMRCLPRGLCKGTVSGLWKMAEISASDLRPIMSCSLPIMQCRWGIPQCTFGSANHIAANTGHVSGPWLIPHWQASIATKFGLCNSLGCWCQAYSSLLLWVPGNKRPSAVTLVLPSDWFPGTLPPTDVMIGPLN